MSEQATKVDVASAKDDLRRELSAEVTGLMATIGGVEKTLSAKIDGLNWKIIGGVIVQVIAIVAGVKPDLAHSAASACGRVVGIDV